MVSWSTCGFLCMPCHVARTLCIQLAGSGGHCISLYFSREQMPSMLGVMGLKDTK